MFSYLVEHTLMLKRSRIFCGSYELDGQHPHYLLPP